MNSSWNRTRNRDKIRIGEPLDIKEFNERWLLGDAIDHNSVDFMAVDVTLPVEEVLADAVDVERATETTDFIVNHNMPDHSHSLVVRIIVYLVRN